ncbi:MAG: hypothetical protein MI749_12010, partial [Desulfovibrionales bacterium]|nr:hypothetical protein [Desulfovibrionales bacterium]
MDISRYITQGARVCMAAMRTPSLRMGVERRGGAAHGTATGHDMDDLYWLNPAVASAAITAS